MPKKPLLRKFPTLRERERERERARAGKRARAIERDIDFNTRARPRRSSNEAMAPRKHADI